MEVQTWKKLQTDQGITHRYIDYIMERETQVLQIDDVQSLNKKDSLT